MVQSSTGGIVFIFIIIHIEELTRKHKHHTHVRANAPMKVWQLPIYRSRQFTIYCFDKYLWFVNTTIKVNFVVNILLKPNIAIRSQNI